MGEILKFPGPRTKLGFRRVKRGARSADNPAQLDLFTSATSPILECAFGLSAFEQALLLDERGDARAAELYGRAIEAQNCVADCYCNLGIIEFQNGNAAKAFDCFTNCLKHNSRHLEAHYNLGNLYFEMDNFLLAQTHYDLALTVDPSFPSAYFNLALIHLINNDTANAATTLKKYKVLVSADEARIAEALLRDLQGH